MGVRGLGAITLTSSVLTGTSPCALQPVKAETASFFPQNACVIQLSISCPFEPSPSSRGAASSLSALGALGSLFSSAASAAGMTTRVPPPAPRLSALVASHFFPKDNRDIAQRGLTCLGQKPTLLPRRQMFSSALKRTLKNIRGGQKKVGGGGRPRAGLSVTRLSPAPRPQLAGDVTGECAAPAPAVSSGLRFPVSFNLGKWGLAEGQQRFFRLFKERFTLFS